MILFRTQDAENWLESNCIPVTQTAIDLLIDGELDVDQPGFAQSFSQQLEDFYKIQKKYPAVFTKLRLTKTGSRMNPSKDKEILQMSKMEMFDAVLNYEGIVGYAQQIMSWLEDIDALQAMIGALNQSAKTNHFD